MNPVAQSPSIHTMTIDPTSPPAPPQYANTAERHNFPTLCWRAIIGGTVAAMGIHILLTALGVGGGLAAFTPMTDANPAVNFSFGAAAIWSAAALVSLWFGGFVAGRFSHSVHSGFVHGVLVWSLSLIVTLLLLSMGTGMVLGGAMKVLGEGLGIGAKVAAGPVDEVLRDATKRTGAHLTSFTDEATQSGPSGAAPKNVTRAKREVGYAVGKMFAPGNESAMEANRTTTINALVKYSGMSEADATKTVDEWIASYRSLKADLDFAKAEAARKAREAADTAAGHLSRAAIWTFFALLAGLLCAALGGRLGADRAVFHASRRGAPHHVVA